MALFLLSKTSLPQRPTRLGPFCYIGAVTSGLMLTAAFPPPGFSWLAWIAFVPLFKAIEGQGPKEGIKLGLIFGLVHFGTLLYWIVYVASHYGRLNLWLSTFPFLLLICYLAIYPVAFCGLWGYLQRGNLGFLAIPFTWTALEFLRAKLLTGFPWCLVGYSQFKNLILIQLASLTGVYGLSFLIVLANFSIFQITVARTKGKMATHLFPLLITLLAIGTALGYGNSVLSGDDSKAKGQALGVLVVQPNIDQSQKWNPSFQEATIQLLETLTRKGATPGLDLIVWPETAIPFFFQENGKLSGQIRALSKQLEVPIIFGSPAYEDSPNGRRYFNRAYLLIPGQERLQWYDKVHLVPFGEYVPLKKFLFFIEKLVHGAGDFVPGKEVRPLETASSKFGILICFEAIFPEISREHVTQGAQYLVNLTNDAWFGKSSAPYQHLAMSVFRAVENRVPLIRAANTGISAIVSPTGQILQQSALFTEEIIVHKIPMPSSYNPTLYTLFGDLFALICLILSGLGVLASFLKK